MTKLAKLASKIDQLREQLHSAEAEFQELRLAELRKVEMTKTGETVTLKFGSRVIKAKKPARYNDRWNLTENGRSIGREVFGGIHDIRFAVATGGI
jgi:hypothetical protein